MDVRTEEAEGRSECSLQLSGRKRCRIKEMLERSRKKREQLKDIVDIHKQLREVTCGLVPGQRVYVRYEYDDIIETTEGGDQPQIIDAKMVWWPAQLAIYNPKVHLGQPSHPVVPAVAEGGAPAAPRPQVQTTEELRQYTASEVFAEISHEMSQEDRQYMAELLKTHADKIVYTLDYEGREAFSPESIPCFFLDHKSLMHLHKCWGGALYRTESNIGEVNIEERLEDGVTAVANLFGTEGDMTNLGDVAEKVVTMLTGFYRHADQVGSRNMTADDVYDWIAQQPEMTIVLARLNRRGDGYDSGIDDEEGDEDILEGELLDDEEPAAEGPPVTPREPGTPCLSPAEPAVTPRLEDTPFPRPS